MYDIDILHVYHDISSIIDIISMKIEKTRLNNATLYARVGRRQEKDVKKIKQN